MQVLIVEDDRVLSLMLTKMVERMGHSVIGAVPSGEEAVEKARSNSIDLILMDIMLEGKIDGIQAMQQINKNRHHVPVIYITGNSDKSTRNRAKSTNYIAYLVKPINYDRLKETITSI